MAYDRREVIQRGTDAAKRLRRRLYTDLRQGIWPECALCTRQALPSAMEIDHILPLSQGGEDVDDNVQVLCRWCHRMKTNDDLGYSTTPF